MAEKLRRPQPEAFDVIMESQELSPAFRSSEASKVRRVTLCDDLVMVTTWWYREGVSHRYMFRSGPTTFARCTNVSFVKPFV